MLASRAVTAMLAVALAVACGVSSHAASTRVWTVSAADLSAGRADGIGWTRSGALFLAPRIAELGGSQTPAGPVQVWSMAADGAGNVYLGTGPEGQILRIGPSGSPRLHFTVAAPMVTALAVTPDGDLLAGVSPGGAVYRISPSGAGDVWAITGERYVWDLAPDAEGSVVAATGESGRVFSIDASGAVSLLFDSDESHVVSLQVPTGGGGLLAGGSGRGLVYRIDGEGHAFVLHDDELPEVTALEAGDHGAVIAAFAAPPEPAARRPAVKLRLPDGVRVGATDEAVGSLEESHGPTLRGYIEGIVADAPSKPERPSGRVARIDVDGTVTELWSSTREVPFGLARDGRGRVVFGTGEPARLYRIEPDGDVALLATLREAQLTDLLSVGDSVVLATSNPAAAYRVEDGAGKSGTFVSRPVDAGAPARWGSIRWAAGGAAGRSELYTRTGNTGIPDETWSAWSPALTDPQASTVVNPDGRFLQWRFRQVGGAEDESRVERIAVHYEPLNRPPRLTGFRLDPANDVGEGERVFRCSVDDPDDDPLEIRLEYRPVGRAAWATAAADFPEGESAEERELEWQTADVAEGEYEVRAVASDQPGNPRGEGLLSDGLTVLSVTVDRSPPRIEMLPLGGGIVQVRVEDALSAVDRLEVVADGMTRFTVRSNDGVSDSTTETYRVAVPDDGGAGWLLRGIDAAGNRVERPFAPDPGTN